MASIDLKKNILILKSTKSIMDCFSILTLSFEHLGQREEVEVKYRPSVKSRSRLYGVSDRLVGFDGRFFDAEKEEKLPEVFKKPKVLFRELECTVRSCLNKKKGKAILNINLVFKSGNEF
jgi:hypothetical protein